MVRRTRLDKRFEDLLTMVRRDADARVGDTELEDAAGMVHRCPVEAQADFAGIGELDGIGEEIQKHLPEALRIDERPLRRDISGLEVERESLFGGSQADELKGLFTI